MSRNDYFLKEKYTYASSKHAQFEPNMYLTPTF